MVVSLKNSFFATFTFISLALAVDPTPTERAKWDAVCMEKAGAQFRMVFDANGKPTGRCEAPPVWKCYWGPYMDAKTGADGCCGKDKGTYSTDPNFPQEGGCCVSPNIFSFDNISNRGGCCPSGQGWTFDGAGAKGGCCATDRRWMVDTSYGTEGCCPVRSKLYTNHITREGSCCMIPEVLSVEISTTKAGCCPTGLQYMTDAPSGQEACCKSTQVFSVDRASNKGGCCDAGKVFVVDSASGKGGCCTAGQIYSVEATSGQGGCCNPGETYKVDELTGNGSCCGHDAVFACDCACKPNPKPTCPTGHGQTFTASNGKKYKLFCGLINHGTNDLGQAPAADWADCINRCAAMSNCVRAIFNPTTKICYLRTHGNQVDPVQADAYDSAHLIEDASPPVPTPDPTPDPPVPTPDPPVPTPDPPVPPPDETIPKECPQADGKRVIVGGIEYQLFCTKSFANTIEPVDATDAKDIEECMANCSKDPDCHGVNFFDDGQPQNCVEASEWEFEPSGNQLPGKTVVAIPVRKR